MRTCLISIGFYACLVGCSSGSAPKGASQAQVQASAPNNNPAAKYLELVGFRAKEKTPGKIEVAFGVVNHSEADLGDLTLNVNMRTTAAKPGDPPLVAFTTKIPSVGPEDMKEVTVTVPTKLRVYELPDWQFLRTDFTVAEPK